MRLITFTTLIAGLLAVALPSAARAEAPTPQAINAHAEFLAYAPPPPAPTKVCVVDTGIDLTTDAASAVVERYSEFGGTVDDTGGGGIPKHGTYVAGLIASQLDGRGSVGIWPQAQIISDRVFPDSASGTTVATYLLALNRCRDRGAKVVNLSLSGLTTATGAELAALENRIVNLRENFGINIVAAAGNNGGDVGYPARFPAVLAVGASEASGDFCGFSSRGPELDVSALGCGAVLSWPGDQLALGNGTSYASPVVSGALAALRAYRPDLTAAAAENLLLGSAQTLGAGKVLDVAAAFRAAGLPIMSSPTPPVASSPARDVFETTEIAVQASPSEATRARWLADLGVRKPRVRSSTYRRGVLAIVVAPVPDYGRAIFVLDGRRYVRSSGKLRLRTKRPPKRITVRIEVPDVGETAAATVTVRRGISPVRGHTRP